MADTELKLLWTGATTRPFVRVEDLEPLVMTGDLSEADLATSARLSAALVELLPDLVRCYARRMEEQQREPTTLYRLLLPGSRTPLSEATAADLEIARHHLRHQAFELAHLDKLLQLIAKVLTAGKSVQDVLSLDQLRATRHLSKPR